MKIGAPPGGGIEIGTDEGRGDGWSVAGSWSDGGVRAAFATARALTLAGLFGRLALVSLGDVPTDDDVEATRSHEGAIDAIPPRTLSHGPRTRR